MARVAREVIYAALLAQLETAGDVFATYTRRWKSIWDDPLAQTAALPMLVQWENAETVSWDNIGIGRVLRLGVMLELYTKIPDGETLGVKDATTSGSEALNPLLDAIDTALMPGDDDGRQTLGGVVWDCRIEGDIVKAMGDEDPSGLCGALVPISILVPF